MKNEVPVRSQFQKIEALSSESFPSKLSRFRDRSITCGEARWVIWHEIHTDINWGIFLSEVFQDEVGSVMTRLMDGRYPADLSIDQLLVVR